MTAWLTSTLVFVAAAGGIGAICTRIRSRRIGVVASAAVPWVLSLLWFGFREFYWPYEGSGVFLWLTTQLVWGSVAALSGVVGFVVTRQIARGSNGAF